MKVQTFCGLIKSLTPELRNKYQERIDALSIALEKYNKRAKTLGCCDHPMYETDCCDRFLKLFQVISDCHDERELEFTIPVCINEAFKIISTKYTCMGLSNNEMFDCAIFVWRDEKLNACIDEISSKNFRTKAFMFTIMYKPLLNYIMLSDTDYIEHANVDKYCYASIIAEKLCTKLRHMSKESMFKFLYESSKYDEYFYDAVKLTLKI